MKDITSTTFGILIAFLLPGTMALGAIAYWAQYLRDIFLVFLSTESNIGLFFLLSFVALALGLQITLLRWLLFDKIIARKHFLDTVNFKKLPKEEALAAFRACVDEHYRYHQFWGGMTFVLPLIYFGWGRGALQAHSFISEAMLFLGFFGIEVVTIIAATQAFKHYIQRGNSIMKGD